MANKYLSTNSKPKEAKYQKHKINNRVSKRNILNIFLPKYFNEKVR